MSAKAPAPRGTETTGAPRTPEERPAPVQPVYERVDLDRYVVSPRTPVGYVEVVPPVFVCYVGHPYAQASEIAQAHDFHEAVQTVLDRASSMHSDRPAE